MPGIKITRKEIKRDELATTIGGLALAMERHARSVAVAAGALVLLGAAIGAGIWLSHGREDAARLKLAEVHRALASPAAEEGDTPLPGSASFLTRRHKYEEVVRRADAVLSQHPSSKAARWAAFYKAVGQKEIGDHSAALETLAALNSGSEDDLLTPSARYLQAQIHEAQGDAQRAAELYTSLASSAPPPFPAEMALMSQARILEGQGKVEEARDIYRRVAQDYPASPYAREASQRLAATSG